MTRPKLPPHPELDEGLFKKNMPKPNFLQREETPNPFCAAIRPGTTCVVSSEATNSTII